jgi:TolA-binding protein
MGKTTIYSLIMCSLLFSCVSVPPPSPQDSAILQRAREDLARGDHDWVIHDMEKYLQNNPRSSLSAEAHLLKGDAYRGQVDQAREEGAMSGLILTTFTAPLISKALESYLAAAEPEAGNEVAAEASYKAGVILDIDYMRHFERAMAVYAKVISEYPGTPWAEKAQSRYNNLNEKFRTIKKGPHGIQGEIN